MHWIRADLAILALRQSFDVVVLAGNVPRFCPLEPRPALVAAYAAQVVPRGAMVAGFQIGPGHGLDDDDAACDAAGLALADRWSTWDGHAFAADGGYAVSVRRH